MKLDHVPGGSDRCIKGCPACAQRTDLSIKSSERVERTVTLQETVENGNPAVLVFCEGKLFGRAVLHTRKVYPPEVGPWKVFPPDDVEQKDLTATVLSYSTKETAVSMLVEAARTGLDPWHVRR